MSEDAPDAPRFRRPARLVALAIAVTALLTFELAAEPLISWRTGEALAGCGVERARVELGARPHLWSVATGRVDDVSMRIDGYHLGPLQIDRVEADVERVDFPRRRLIGIAAPLELTGGTATATITGDALGEVMDVPFASIRITPEGIFLVVLGARIQVLIGVEDGRLELRLVDESFPALRIEAPAGTKILDVTTAPGQLLVTARLPRSISADAAC